MSRAIADKNITLTASAQDAITECRTLIVKARDWSYGADLSWDEVVDNGEAIVAERRSKVDSMEESFYSNFLSMITMGFGEEVKVMRDSEACFFFSYSSGFHGGLIFHRDQSLSKAGEPLTIGTWSLHS